MPETRAAIVYDSLDPINVGGGERVYRRIAELLVERGVRTDYVTRKQWQQEPPQAPFRIVGVWSGEIYDADGIRRTSSAVAFAVAVFRYFRHHRRDYDLVLASALPVLTVLAVRAALLGSRARVVADWLEIWPARKWRAYSGAVSGTVAAMLQWIAARTVDEHTVNSGFTAGRLQELRPSLDPLVLGLSDLVDERAATLAAAPPYLLFVGRLIADKRASLVPAVIGVARQALPTLRGVIVGTGTEHDAVSRAIAESGLQDAVDLLGRIGDEELAALRSSAAVMFAPSVREGFGIAVLESAASGVPVVVARHPDNAAEELVEPGVNGYLVDADAVPAMADAIVRVVSEGAALRESTLAWFRRARATRGLSATLDALMPPSTAR